MKPEHVRRIARMSAKERESFCECVALIKFLSGMSTEEAVILLLNKEAEAIARASESASVN